MWTKIYFITVFIILISIATAAIIRNDIFNEPVQEYDVIIKNVEYEDSPVEENLCPEGYKLDFLKVCREVW